MQRRVEMAVMPVVVIILAAAAALRLYHLGHNSLWADEGSSVAIAGLSWHSFAAIVWAREINMVLYYLLLKGWMQLGMSEAFLRLPSAMASTATVWAVYWLGKRLSGGSAWAGLTAAAFLAVNAWSIESAQEARSYALLLLAGSLAAIFLVKAVEGAQRYWWAFAGIVVAGIYLHLYMVFVAGALLASLLALPPSEIPWKNAGRAVLASLAGSVPMLIYLATHDEDRMGWLPRMSRGLLQQFLTSLAGFSSVAGYILLGLVILAGWHLARSARWRGRSAELWRESLALCWLVLPVAAVALYSLHSKLFLPRYMQICLPAAAVVAGMAVARLPKAAGAAAACALLALMGWQLPWYYRHAPHEDWRSATEYVLKNAQPGDVAVIYLPNGRGSFEYYRQRMGGSSDVPEVVYPGTRVMDEKGLNGIPFVYAAGTLKPEYSTVWILLNNVDFSPEGHTAAQSGLEMMDSRFHSHTERDFEQMRVYRYVR